jgi:alkylhydroperoxidase family enzyme
MRMTWIRTAGEGSSDFDRLMALAPELADDYQAFDDLFWQRELLPRPLLELLRIQVARLLDCSSERARRRPLGAETDTLELKVAALADLDTNECFDAGERACLRFAEKFLFDVHGITDDDVAAVRAELGIEGTVALCEVMALYDGFARFRKVLAD